MNNTWRKFFIASLIVGLIIVAILTFQSKERNNVDILLNISMLVSEHKIGEVQVIGFAKISQLQWERVYFFEPYTSRVRILDSLGFIWLGVKNTTIDTNDGVTLIVFTKGKKVVAFVEFPRNVIDFSSLVNNSGYSYADAKFVINEKGKVGLLAQ